MTYYVYMVRCADGSHYTGLCTDPARRMREHVQRLPGCAKYTRSHPVVSLDALWRTDSRSHAATLEALIKRLSKSQKLALIASPGALTAMFGDALDVQAYTAVPGAALGAYFP